MWRKLILLITIFGMILFGAGSAAAQDKSYSADRFDVDVVVQEDSSLLVTETVVFSFVGEPFTFVFRELPTEFTDGVTILSASLDGRSLPQGTEAGQVEIEDGRDILITWHMEPTVNSSRTFVLEYEMLGVVRQAEAGDLLRFQPLPDEFEYNIDSSTVTITYPNTAVLQTSPAITVGEAQVSSSGNQATFTQQNIESDETLVVEMLFEAGSLITTAPQWQSRQAEQNALAPLWIGLSAFILAVGIVATIWIWQRHQPKVYKGSAVVYEPPNDLPPAIAGVLNGVGASPTWPNALATLFDLADRGILSIEESDEKKWYRSQDFTIMLKQQPGSLRPHEQGLLDLLFDTKEGRKKSVKLSKLGSAISSKQWKKYTEPLEAELKAAGYIDAARKTRRQWIIGGSFLLFALGMMALAAVPAVLEELYGFWPILISFSILMVFVIVVTTGTKLTILTDEAKLMADEWQTFYTYLKDVTKKKAAVGQTSMFTRFLPYAASYGLLHQWANFFHKEGWTELPPYFHALNQSGDGGMAAFVAMTATSSSSGGSAAGGAAGAGAAGGGASGAG